MRHHKNGTTDVDWFQLAIDEAKSDPIALWAVVKEGRDGFGLEGQALESFVYDYVFAMLKGGANPVLGDRSRSSGWQPLFHYGADAESATVAIFTEWMSTEHKNPDQSIIWFAFPNVWK